MRALGLSHVLLGAEAHIHQGFKTSSVPSVLEKHKQQNKHSQSCKYSSSCGSNHDSPCLGFVKGIWKYEMTEVRTVHNSILQITQKTYYLLHADNYDYLCSLVTYWPQAKFITHHITETHIRAGDASFQRSLQLNLNFNNSYKFKC